MISLDKLTQMSEYIHLEPAEETGCVKLDTPTAAPALQK